MAAFALADGVSFLAASPGTGAFVFSQARSSFLTLAQAQAQGEIADGNTYSYVAQDSLSAPTQREWGVGTYSFSGNSLARTTVYRTVNIGVAGTGSALNFTTAPIVSLTVLSEDLVETITPTPTPGQNINYYVATTGSDSNSGLSAGTPFRSITKALFAAARIDHQFAGGFPIINIAAGTYTLGANGENIFLGMPTLLGCLNGGQINGASSTTTIIHDPSGNGVFVGINGPECEWFIGNLQTDTAAIHYGSSDLINYVIAANIVCADSSASGTGIMFSMTRSAHVELGFGSVTVTDTTFKNFFSISEGGRVTGFGATIILPAANNTNAGGAFITNANYGPGWVDLRGASITNATAYGASGLNARVQITNSGQFTLLTNNAALSDIPGAAAHDTFDLGLQITSNTGVPNIHVNSLAGIPTASNISAGFWGVWKDTSGGGVYVITNDGGSIKKVALT